MRSRESNEGVVETASSAKSKPGTKIGDWDKAFLKPVTSQPRAVAPEKMSFIKMLKRVGDAGRPCRRPRRRGIGSERRPGDAPLRTRNVLSRYNALRNDIM